MKVFGKSICYVFVVFVCMRISVIKGLNWKGLKKIARGPPTPNPCANREKRALNFDSFKMIFRKQYLFWFERPATKVANCVRSKKTTIHMCFPMVLQWRFLEKPLAVFLLSFLHANFGYQMFKLKGPNKKLRGVPLHLTLVQIGKKRAVNFDSFNMIFQKKIFILLWEASDESC